MLGNLLQKVGGAKQSTEKGKRINDVFDLFSKEKPVIAEPEIVDITAALDAGINSIADAKLSAQEQKEREERTVFVGNIPLEASNKQIAKEFAQYGTVEKIWIRSLPVEESKMPKKASVILKQFKDGVDRKNAYILFATVEEARKSLESNGKKFMEKHLRVDLAGEKKLDFQQTVFVGNLHFKIQEEQLRAHFEDCGTIVNVRVIRDPVTHDGKGFGYVCFQEKESFQNALQKHETKLLFREIRVKKAVSADRLEKKQKKVADKVITINRSNAVHRLQKRLDKQAVVQDKKEDKHREEAPKKAFKGDDKREKSTKPFAKPSAKNDASQSAPKVKKPIQKIEKKSETPKPIGNNIFTGGKGSRPQQRQAKGKDSAAGGKKKASASSHSGTGVAKKDKQLGKKKDFTSKKSHSS